MGKSKVGWNIPPHEGFKGKIIKLNSGFSSKPCLPKGQSFFLQFWVKIWDLVLPGDPQQPCAWLRERWHHRSSFPIDDFSISWWGHNKRRAAGDFVWNSEKDDLKFRHLFVTVETSWNILEDIFVYHVVFFHVCSTFIAVVAGSHAAQPWDPSEYVGQTLLQAGPGRFWSWYFGIFGMLPYVAMRWPD